MRNNNISLLSGKVKKVASTSADANRYTFLDLKNSEPDAGVPSSHSSQRGIFGSDINGTRQWFYADAGLSIDVSTGQITVNENTVYIDTALFTNSISDNLAAVLYDLDVNLQQLGNNTLSTVATDNTILGAGTTGSPLSIGQAVFFTSKPEFAGLAITPNSINVSGVNLANPVVITTTSAHGLSDGQLITIENITGTTQLNGNNYYVDVQSTSTFTLYSDQALSTSVDGSGYTAYTSSGKILSGGYRFPEADGADGTYLKTNSWGELEFDRPIQYGGTQPTTPDLGDLWLDSITSGDLLIWTGSVWSQCGGGGSQGAFLLRQFQGDGSTTAFDTANPSVNKVLVFLNGILMRLTDDFTFIAGVITFPSAPQTNDTIEVLLTGDASYVGLELLGIDNHDLITVDSAGNVTLIGDLDMGTNRIVNLVDPVNPQDGATKAYVDSIVGATDLDFAGGTGTGTVDLDSQTFTISGTANEIETSAAGQIITIGLPTNITVDVTGNADTATTLASSRDFSLTGAVTASAISFNGSGDVALSTIIDFDVSDNYAFKSITDGTTTAIADSNADTFKIRVQNQIEAIVTNDDATHGDSVLFGHADSGVAANTYGSATAIPNITVDAQGHITAVTTSTISTSWLLSDGVTSESIGGGDTLTVSGTTGEIEVAVSATDTLTIGLPNDVTIGNDLVVTGNLTVNGTTTTINSTELAVNDLNITIASGALNAAAANGAGITVDGASATLTYTNADDRWNFNKDLTVANVYSNVTGTVSNISNHNTDNLSEGSSNLYYTDVRADARIAAASVDDLNDVDITSSVPTDGQALIWDNANSKFIPGDSFSQGDFDTAFTAKDTDDLSEGATNLYYTDVRADARIAAASVDDLSDVNITGVSNGEILKYVSASSEFQTSLITTSMMDPTNVFADQFTASGSTDVFTLSDDPGSKNAIQVFVDGVPQLASGYTVVGTTLTLGGIPTAGQIVEVRGYGIALPVGTVADASITGVKLQDGTIGLNKISPSDYYNATTFTAGASQTVYTLSVDPGSPYAITVYVSGVWQKPVTNYSVVGTTMTLASPPTTGAEVYVRYYGVALTVGTVADSSITGAKLQNGTITIDKIAVSAYQNQTFTGDNTTTDFTLNTDPSAAQALLVMVDNVIQEPVENYTTSGTTLTFTGAPSTSARIYVRFLGLPVAIGAPSDGTVTNAALNLTYTSNQYTGNNTTTAYTIQAGHNAHSLLVILDGLILPPSDYSINGSTLTFAAAPLLNQSIDIRYMPV